MVAVVTATTTRFVGLPRAIDSDPAIGKRGGRACEHEGEARGDRMQGCRGLNECRGKTGLRLVELSRISMSSQRPSVAAMEEQRSSLIFAVGSSLECGSLLAVRGLRSCAFGPSTVHAPSTAAHGGRAGTLTPSPSSIFRAPVGCRGARRPGTADGRAQRPGASAEAAATLLATESAARRARSSEEIAGTQLRAGAVSGSLGQAYGRLKSGSNRTSAVLTAKLGYHWSFISNLARPHVTTAAPGHSNRVADSAGTRHVTRKQIRVMRGQRECQAKHRHRPCRRPPPPPRPARRPP